MSILTEKEREDVYKYWLHSSTLTNEDGLIQLAEKAVLEKLAGVELPEPYYAINEVGEKVPYFTAPQLHQAFAQGAASQLSVEPVFQYRKGFCSDWYDGNPDHKDGGGPYITRILYTLKEAK